MRTVHLPAVPVQEAAGRLGSLDFVEGEADAAFVRAHRARVARAAGLQGGY